MKKRLYQGIAAGLILLFGVEMLFSHPHYGYWWHRIPGADILLGFCGCWLLMLLAKKLLYPFVRRNASYYDEKRKEEQREETEDGRIFKAHLQNEGKEKGEGGRIPWGKR